MSERFGELIDALARPEVNRVTVRAPAGHGKSAVLADVAARLRATGAPVALTPAEAGPGTVLIVDDAHRLGPEQLDRLRVHALEHQGGLVLACVPGSETVPAFRDLLDTTTGPTFTLSLLDIEQIAAVLATRLGREAPEGLARHVHTFTGGVPRYVAWWGEAARGGQRAADKHAAARLADTMTRLDPALIRLVTAADVCGPGAVDVHTHVLGTDRAGVVDQLRAMAAAALARPDGTPLPVAAMALRAGQLALHRSATLHTIAEARRHAGHPVLDVAEALLGCSATGVSAAATYLAGAREIGRDQPDRATVLYAAAADAGAKLTALGAEWAEMAALSGDFDTALRLTESVLADDDVESRAAAAGIGAAVAAQRGELMRSAELGLWADGVSRHHAVIGLIGAGLPERALEVSKTIADRVDAVPPAATADAAARTASAIEQSISAQPARALPALLRAAALTETEQRLLPDSPAALAAIVGLHSGELALAHAVLERALAASADGPHATRHRALLGMVALARGNVTAAGTVAATVRASGRRLTTRDELFVAALETGIARRAGDLTALAAAWHNAYHTLMALQPDLFTLLPFTELLVAAARLAESPRLRTHLEQARSLLAALGDPPLWTANVHWAHFQAAVLRDDTESTVAAVSELDRHAHTSRYARVLAATARTWTEVLAGSADPDTVTAAADDLHAFGLHWDAARLAAQAATRTTDRAAMVSLLETARRVRCDTNPTDVVATGPTTSLSVREVEVARLVVQGLTYNQVGARLYISGKTVEHHVAKIRTKLQAGDRRDLLRKLRDLFGADKGTTATGGMPS